MPAPDDGVERVNDPCGALFRAVLSHEYFRAGGTVPPVCRLGRWQSRMARGPLRAITNAAERPIWGALPRRGSRSLCCRSEPKPIPHEPTSPISPICRLIERLRDLCLVGNDARGGSHTIATDIVTDRPSGRAALGLVQMEPSSLAARLAGVLPMTCSLSHPMLRPFLDSCRGQICPGAQKSRYRSFAGNAGAPGRAIGATGATSRAVSLLRRPPCNDGLAQLTFISSPERQRRWSVAEREEIVLASFAPDAVVAGGGAASRCIDQLSTNGAATPGARTDVCGRPVRRRRACAAPRGGVCPFK